MIPPSPAPRSVPLHPILDLGLPNGVPHASIARFLAQHVLDAEKREACDQRLADWAKSETVEYDREFGRVRQQVEDVTAGGYGWRQDPEARALFLSAVTARSRACSRQVDREVALLSSLAVLAGESPDAEAWRVLDATLEFGRASAISCAMLGAQANLSGLATGVGQTGEFPIGTSALDASRREYLLGMAPLWAAKRTAWEKVLERTVTPGDGNPRSQLDREPRGAWAAIVLSLQLANEWWAEQFPAVVGGAEGNLLARRLDAAVRPTVRTGVGCSFEDLLEETKSAVDPEVAMRLAIDLKARCFQVRDIQWAVDRTNCAKMLRGDVVSLIPIEEREQMVLEALVDESARHLLMLKDLGCGLNQDPCASELDALQAHEGNLAQPNRLSPSDQPQVRH